MSEVPLENLTLERFLWLRRARSAPPTWRRVSGLGIRVSVFEFWGRYWVSVFSFRIRWISGRNHPVVHLTKMPPLLTTLPRRGCFHTEEFDNFITDNLPHATMSRALRGANVVVCHPSIWVQRTPGTPPWGMAAVMAATNVFLSAAPLGHFRGTHPARSRHHPSTIPAGPVQSTASFPLCPLYCSQA